MDRNLQRWRILTGAAEIQTWLSEHEVPDGRQFDNVKE